MSSQRALPQLSRHGIVLLVVAAASTFSVSVRGDERAEGLRAYRAARFTDALAAFEAAARKRPSDPEPLADVALVLQKLDRNDEAIAANRKVVALAARPGKGTAHSAKLAKIRRGAYFNLGRLGITLAVPEADACGRIASQDGACKKPLFACRKSRLDAGSGLGTHWDVLRIARSKGGAAFEQDDYDERPPLVIGISEDAYSAYGDAARRSEVLADQQGDALLRYGEEEMGDECARIHGSEWSCSSSEAVKTEALRCLGGTAPETASNHDLETSPASAACFKRACRRAEQKPWPAVTAEVAAHASALESCYGGLTEIEDTTCAVVHADACTGWVGLSCTTTVDRDQGEPKPDRRRAYEVKIPPPE